MYSIYGRKEDEGANGLIGACKKTGLIARLERSQYYYTCMKYIAIYIYIPAQLHLYNTIYVPILSSMGVVFRHATLWFPGWTTSLQWTYCYVRGMD